MSSCDKCNCLYKINQVSEENPHDCIESMKAQIVEIDANNYKIKEKFGINYDVMNNKCKSYHPLKVHVGLVRSYNG